MDCHFFSRESLPDPGVEPMSPALSGRFFMTKPPGKPGVSSLGHHSLGASCESSDRKTEIRRWELLTFFWWWSLGAGLLGVFGHA